MKDKKLNLRHIDKRWLTVRCTACKKITEHDEDLACWYCTNKKCDKQYVVIKQGISKEYFISYQKGGWKHKEITRESD